MRRTTLLWIANGISLVSLSLIMFRLQAPATYFGYDGTFLLSLVKNQAEFMPSVTAYSMDFLKGMGGMQFPLNSRLMPGFIVAVLAGTADWLPAISATWFAGEFAIATFIIGRSIGIPAPATVLAIWIGLLGALPYFVPTIAMERLWGTPAWLSFISSTMLALALFLVIGRGSRLQSLACGIGIFLLLVYLTMTFTLFAPNALPILVFLVECR